MDQKLALGEVTIVEFNLIMKLLASGSIADHLDLFMRFRMIGVEFDKKLQAQQATDAPVTLAPPQA